MLRGAAPAGVHAVTTVADEDGPPVPELVRRVTLDAESTDPPTTMAAALTRLRQAGTTVVDVLAAGGDAYRVAERCAGPLRSRQGRWDGPTGVVGPVHGTEGGPVLWSWDAGLDEGVAEREPAPLTTGGVDAGVSLGRLSSRQREPRGGLRR